MKIEMLYLLLAFATVLAPMAQGQSTPPQPKITGVLTILSPKPGVTVEQVMKIMPAEIRATVPLYLDGKIQQWFTRGDRTEDYNAFQSIKASALGRSSNT